ncbi:hypothetical protein Micbo1qcDRAFT_205374 [Microdochium bolleyi]|uniref:2EXR domain-containing protein n=1 Tax=Microdochium bolleyi TaxID=196109 RepID=A0A136IZY7_9PEZI|nr:hypothetical protein Micbo1qcDRAFT_205374 [Microdochium bolleyi]
MSRINEEHFPRFSELPVELRHKIWHHALEANTTAEETTGPGLWPYRPGSWQARFGADLEGEEHWKDPWWPTHDEADTLHFAHWMMSTNVLAPSPVARVNRDARDAAARWARLIVSPRKAYAQARAESRHIFPPPTVPDGADDDPEYDPDDECYKQGPTQDDTPPCTPYSRRRHFDVDRDALYIADSETWDLCDAERAAADEAADDGRGYGAGALYSSIDRVAMTRDTLMANFGRIGVMMEKLSSPSQLLLIVGDPPAADDGGWWEFVDARKGVFQWKPTPRHVRGEVGKFAFCCNEEDGDVPEDELCGFMEGIGTELGEAWGKYDDGFQVQAVYAVKNMWA